MNKQAEGGQKVKEGVGDKNTKDSKTEEDAQKER